MALQNLVVMFSELTSLVFVWNKIRMGEDSSLSEEGVVSYHKDLKNALC